MQRKLTLYNKQDTKTSRGILSKAWYTDDAGNVDRHWRVREVTMIDFINWASDR